MTDILHIFTLNEDVAVTHTNLTRQKGEAPVLPPLADWLGVETLDTNAIELFQVKDLSDMALSDYIQLAFAPENDIPGDMQTRLNALKGAVLLVPDTALNGPASPGPQATTIAALPLAQADNTGVLPKASVTPMPTPPAAQTHEASPPIALFALIGMAVLAAIIVLVGWN